MKVYVDLVLFLNFFIDFLILMSVSLVLKRNSSLKRIVLSSIIGSLTIFILFFNIGSFLMFIIKFSMSLILVLVSFGYKDIKYTLNNLFYFYVISIILGGSIYFLNLELGDINGLFFINNKYSINFIVLLFIVPIILYIYIKSTYKLKRDINTHKCVDVYLKNGKVIKLNGFLDTGNNMIDPITKKVVVIVNSKKIFNEFKDLYYLVPYNTIEGSGLMKCIVPKFIYVSDIGKVNNVVIGYTSQEFKIEGVNCLLNNLLKGE